MCIGCSDWIASCQTCGPKPPAKGRFLKHFYLGETPCEHVIAEHRPGCTVAQGQDCDCEDDDDA